MRESRALEFKEILTNTFLETVSAYANYGTCQIVFGVDDEGKAVGIGDIAGMLLAIENKVNDSIAPVPEFTLEANDKTGTITLTVREGPHKPYFYKSKAYRRAGTATVEVDRLELSRLVLQGQSLSFESTDAQMDGLSFTRLEEALKEKTGVSEVTDDTLRTLELMRPNGSFNVAGELLADKTRSRASMQCVLATPSAYSWISERSRMSRCSRNTTAPWKCTAPTTNSRK